jgi:hypothetical protein
MNRVLKNKYRAVSQGAQPFGQRSIHFEYVSMAKSRATPDHGPKRRFSTAC